MKCLTFSWSEILLERKRFKCPHCKNDSNIRYVQRSFEYFFIEEPPDENNPAELGMMEDSYTDPDFQPFFYCLTCDNTFEQQEFY